MESFECFDLEIISETIPSNYRAEMQISSKQNIAVVKTDRKIFGISLTTRRLLYTITIPGLLELRVGLNDRFAVLTENEIKIGYIETGDFMTNPIQVAKKEFGINDLFLSDTDVMLGYEPKTSKSLTTFDLFKF